MRLEGDVSDLSLDFTVDNKESYYEKDPNGEVKEKFRVHSYDLVEDGSNKKVTNENALEYVHRVAHWHLNFRIGRPADLFGKGLTEVEYQKIY